MTTNYVYTSMEVPVGPVTVPIERVERDRHSTDRVRTMTESMQEHGLLMPILIDRDWVLIDGERRLIIARALGWTRIPARVAQVKAGDLTEEERIELARVANVEREQISRLGEDAYARLKQKSRSELRAAIAESLKAKPELSNRQHALRTGASDKTIASVRSDLEATAEIPQLNGTTGADGRTRRAPVRTTTPEAKHSDQPQRADTGVNHDNARAGEDRSDDPTGTVTALPKKHQDVEAVEAVLGDLVLRANQLMDGLAGLTKAGADLAAYESVHRQAALASRNARAREVIREVLAVSLDGLDQLRAVLAEDLADLDAAGEGEAA